MRKPESRAVIGWDVGGVQSKAAAVTARGELSGVESEPFEIWKAPEELEGVLERLASSLEVEEGAVLAVTMTAELSDCFRTKAEGVTYVLERFRRVFGNPTLVLAADGVWWDIAEALADPRRFAATNWLAAALRLSRSSDALWVDVGSTTTDIIPLSEGPAGWGKSDAERLQMGQLVYTGVVRTNPNTLAAHVPLDGGWCRTAAESFAFMADCYLLLGELEEEGCTAPTPDGRPADREHAVERLARLVCGDRESLPAAEMVVAARYLRERQLALLTEGILQVISATGLPGGVVATGAGAFLAREAARRLALPMVEPRGLPPEGMARHLPAAAAALECFHWWRGES